MRSHPAQFSSRFLSRIPAGGPGYDRRACVARTRKARRKRSFTENPAFRGPWRDGLLPVRHAPLIRPAWTGRSPSLQKFLPSENILSPAVYPVYARLTLFPKLCDHARHDSAIPLFLSAGFRSSPRTTKLTEPNSPGPPGPLIFFRKGPKTTSPRRTGSSPSPCRS